MPDGERTTAIDPAPTIESTTEFTDAHERRRMATLHLNDTYWRYVNPADQGITEDFVWFVCTYEKCGNRKEIWINRNGRLDAGESCGCYREAQRVSALRHRGELIRESYIGEENIYGVRCVSTTSERTTSGGAYYVYQCPVQGLSCRNLWLSTRGNIMRHPQVMSCGCLTESLSEYIFAKYLQNIYPHSRSMLNSRQRVGKYKLDVYDPISYKVFEHDGDFWHTNDNSKRDDYILANTEVRVDNIYHIPYGSDRSYEPLYKVLMQLGKLSNLDEGRKMMRAVIAAASEEFLSTQSAESIREQLIKELDNCLHRGLFSQDEFERDNLSGLCARICTYFNRTFVNVRDERIEALGLNLDSRKQKRWNPEAIREALCKGLKDGLWTADDWTRARSSSVPQLVPKHFPGMTYVELRNQIIVEEGLQAEFDKAGRLNRGLSGKPSHRNPKA